MVLGECPFCHRLLAAEQVSKEEVDSSITVDQREPARIAAGRYTPTKGPTDYPAEDLITYKLTFRCKHCGKEWTKLSNKEVDLPRSYVLGEEEKTEYDAEEEGAREEEYVRET
jgi:ribosomal protein L44E